MNFDLSDLRAFIAVADHASFSVASAELHLSQSAMSRRIERLENALGVSLFERTTRKVELTTVGREFLRKARELLVGLEESMMGMRDTAEKMRGEVTVSCVPSAVRYFLPDVLKTYHQQYPNMLVRVIDEGANEVLAAVARSEADFGLNYIGIQEPDIDFQAILKEAFVLACRSDHPLAGRKKVSWAELGDYEYMTVTRASGNRVVLDQALAESAIRPRWFCEVRHVLTLVGLVEAGLGIAVVPRLAMPQEGHPSLLSIPLAEPAVSRTIGLISRRGRPLPPAAQRLYDMILAMRQLPRSRAVKTRKLTA
ncbi:LysR family transcriptional regulator [Undibacterium terreum]|uniref:LysR family transcriptional regulator n=1 Tax=Undibacterium terreum TaxID=1224302 RepID=UPI001669A137|nr:LysR family transcriptional regulator [Undibacterium terreum]